MPMTRPAWIAPALALAFVILLPAGSEVISGGPAVGPAEAQADLMQCMERCLRHEGRDKKDVCKLRCANVPPITPGVAPGAGRGAGAGAGRGGGRDCMARYKDCQAACARDKACKRACRKRLLTCK